MQACQRITGDGATRLMQPSRLKYREPKVPQTWSTANRNRAKHGT